MDDNINGWTITLFFISGVLIWLDDKIDVII